MFAAPRAVSWATSALTIRGALGGILGIPWLDGGRSVRVGLLCPSPRGH